MLDKLRRKIAKNLLNVVYTDDSHTYKLLKTDEGLRDRPLISCTTAIKQYESPFDTKWHAIKAEQWNAGTHFPNDIEGKANYKSYPYLKDGKWTEEGVRDYWANLALMGTTMGTNVHNYLENRFKGKIFPLVYPEFSCEEDEITYKRILNEKQAGATKFYNAYNKMVPVELELLVYNQYMAGQMDGLFEFEGELYQIDYKNDGHISTRSNFYLTGPLSHLPACNYTKYRLQTTIYKELFEAQYDMKLDHIWVVHITPFEFDLYCIEPLTKEAKIIINDQERNYLSNQITS